VSTNNNNQYSAFDYKINHTYTLGGGFASHADDGEVLGDTKVNGTDCGSRESQVVGTISSLKGSSLGERK
jgi:hypothetical protein